MPIRKVNIQVAPNLNMRPAVKFDRSRFDAAIWQRGYPVYHDKMIRCPCGGAIGQPLVTCGNCIGTGYILIERVQTRMLLQSMNMDTKFKEWSEERMGTVGITAFDKDVLGFMDRIVVLQAIIPFNEILKIRKREAGTPNKFAYTVYDIIAIVGLYKWTSDSAALTKLIEGTDYTYEKNKIIFSDDYDDNDDIRVTAKYYCNPQYHIIDIPRNVINQDVTNVDGVEGPVQNERFPVHAIGRLSHYVLDAENYNGNLIIDNSESALEAGVPVVLIPSNPSYQPLSYSTLYVNLDQLRNELTEQHQQIIDLIGVTGTYVLQDLDESDDYTYVGYTKITGEWLIKRLEDLGEGNVEILYANISNNDTFTEYDAAWEGRENLVYQALSELTF